MSCCFTVFALSCSCTQVAQLTCRCKNTSRRLKPQSAIKPSMPHFTLMKLLPICFRPLVDIFPTVFPRRSLLHLRQNRQTRSYGQTQGLRTGKGLRTDIDFGQTLCLSENVQQHLTASDSIQQRPPREEFLTKSPDLGILHTRVLCWVNPKPTGNLFGIRTKSRRHQLTDSG